MNDEYHKRADLEDDLEARIVAARVRWAERRERDRIRIERASLPEEQARIERLRQDRVAERKRVADEAEAAYRRVTDQRNFKAEEHLRRIEAGLPHDGHPSDPDWDRL